MGCHQEQQELYECQTVIGPETIHGLEDCEDSPGGLTLDEAKDIIADSSSEKLPTTNTRWALLFTSCMAAILGYEFQLQRKLTCPPTTFAQCDSGPLREVYEQMASRENSILRRPIQPSLFVGTRAIPASFVGISKSGPPPTEKHIQFRQILTMPIDGAQVALDWELPVQEEVSADQRRITIADGPIPEPVVLICHGINNDATFGYIRSMMRACTDRGWNAAGMNFRGCGGVPMTTPRVYNAAYTGDIRCVVHQISSRLVPGVPLFLVGNSLGANIVAKYLGEEGLSGTLPDCVAGGVTMGNPMMFEESNINSMWSNMLALGRKKFLLENWASLFQFKSQEYLAAIKKALLAAKLYEFDAALAPFYSRNDVTYPFAFQVGFKDGQNYWDDAGSFRLVPSISVPFLQLIACDDFLVYKSFRRRMLYNLSNPNIMVVETKCGGHLGWQESPPEGSPFNFLGKRWADEATADFIEAVLSLRKAKLNQPLIPSETVSYASKLDGFSLGVDQKKMRSRL